VAAGPPGRRLTFPDYREAGTSYSRAGSGRVLRRCARAARRLQASSAMARSNPSTAARARRAIVLAVAALSLVAPGCSSTTAPPGGRFTTSQQLLATEAVDRALAQVAWPDVLGRKVFVDVAAPSGDPERLYLENVVSAELATRGAILVPDVSAAEYVALVNADAIGIEQDSTFVGLPAVESAIVPIGLPEITVYDSNREEGYARIEIVFADLKNGGVLARSGPVDSETWAQQRTYLLFPTHDSNTEELKENPR